MRWIFNKLIRIFKIELNIGFRPVWLHIFSNDAFIFKNIFNTVYFHCSYIIKIDNSILIAKQKFPLFLIPAILSAILKLSEHQFPKSQILFNISSLQYNFPPLHKYLKSCSLVFSFILQLLCSILSLFLSQSCLLLCLLFHGSRMFFLPLLYISLVP